MNMSDIEQKALELLNAVLAERVHWQMTGTRTGNASLEALCRALEAHELDKSRHAAELREQAERFSQIASSALAMYQRSGEGDCLTAQALRTFILVPVDPLVEAIHEANDGGGETVAEWSTDLRAALDARGLAIVKKEAANG